MSVLCVAMHPIAGRARVTTTDAQTDTGADTFHDPVTSDAAVGEPAVRHAPPWRNAVRAVILLGFGAVAVVLIRNQIPRPGELVAALAEVHPAWLTVAVIGQMLALSAFGMQQRFLLGAFGVRIGRGRALALAYSRTAIGVSLPAGSAISAGFAYQQFRARGAVRSTATIVVVLSGLASTLALIIIYLGGAGVTAAGRHPEQAGLVAGVAIACAAAIRVTRRLRVRNGGGEAPQRPAVVRWTRLNSARDAVTGLIGTIRAIPGHRWGLVVALAGASWLADLSTLAAICAAFELSIGPLTVAGIYLGVQVLRQIPISPGGIGVIEASLLAGFAATGVAAGPASAAVLLYRLLSCWLIIPAGLVAWTWLRRTVAAPEPVSASPAP